MYASTKGIYSMISGKYLLIVLVSNENFKHVIKGGDGLFGWNNTSEEYFMKAYVEDLSWPEHVRTSNKQLRTILNPEYKIADLYKVIRNECQNVLTEIFNELL